MGRTARVVISLAAIGSLAVVAAPAANAADHPVDVQDNQFAPAQIEVTEGDRVVWTQSGSNPHSVTSDDGEFDSHPNCFPACMQQGQSFDHTFDEAGEYPYYCRVHGGPGGSGMSGVVIVNAAVQESPSETQTTSESPSEDTTASPSDTSTATPESTATTTESPAVQETGAQATPSPMPTTGGGNRGLAAVAALAALTVGGGWVANARRRPTT